MLGIAAAEDIQCSLSPKFLKCIEYSKYGKKGRQLETKRNKAVVFQFPIACTKAMLWYFEKLFLSSIALA